MSSALETTVVPFLRRLARCNESIHATDAELLTAFVNTQEESAFRTIVDRHGPMVLGVCRRVLQNVHDAEDAFQAVFLVLARKGASISPRDMLANWLHGVAYRTALKIRVGRARANAHQQRMMERVSAMPQPAAITSDNWIDLEPILDEELARLSEKYRAAIVLCDLEGKSRKDAARLLNWSEGTLSGRLARARKLLAKRLTARGITLSLAGMSTAFTTSKTLAVVPAIIKSNVVRAGLLIAAGKTLPTTLVSTQVVALAEQVVKTMVLTKHWIAIAFFTAVGFLFTGAGLIAHISADDDPKTPPVVQQPKPLDAEVHVIGVYESKPGGSKKGQINVEVRKTAKPVILVMTSYFPVEWNVKLADGARLAQVIASGYNPQEVVGVPANVPIINQSYFPDDGSRRKDGWFWSSDWNSPRGREMTRRINEMTQLPIATFQSEISGETFVIDGKRGREFAQKSLPKPQPVQEPTLDELRKASAGSELHIVATYRPENDGNPIEVEVPAATRPIVLVLSSYLDAVWRIKPAKDARIAAVIVTGLSPQEIEGLPEGVLVYHCNPAPASLFDGEGGERGRRSFYAHRWNTIETRRMIERLNHMTGLLMSSFQGGDRATSFVVDGKRGSELAQKERASRSSPRKEVKPDELRALAQGAELQLVSIYGPRPGSNGDQVDIEVKATDKPIVLVLASYYTALWNVNLAADAQVRAIIIAGYFEQEFRGIPDNIPVVQRAYFPDMQRGFFYGYKAETREYADLTEKVNALTGLKINTAQLAEAGSWFVIDGTRGRDQEQKAGTVKAPKPPVPKSDDDPLADVADIPSQDLKANGDADKRYFLIGPKKDLAAPTDGFGLVVIMPGGDGSADFNPFVRRIYKNVLSGNYLAVQPVAKKWTANQQIVWPTKTNPVHDMKFSTEEFITAVVNDVAKTNKIDRSRVFTLTWSSSGPAAYAASLQADTPITGSFIAMSVFQPKFLPPLQAAKGHPYYRYHSQDDRVCPFRMAEQAKTELTKQGATVQLATYAGGHGWRGNLYADLHTGIEWLEKNRKKAGSEK